MSDNNLQDKKPVIKWGCGTKCFKPSNLWRRSTKTVTEFARGV